MNRRSLHVVITLFSVFALILSSVVTAGAAPPADRPESDIADGGTLDDLFAEVAQRAPGFGGMFLDGQVLKVYLRDAAQQAAAERAIADVFGRERIPVGGVQPLQGQYGFLQLNAWHGRMGSLFDIPEVVLTDVDEATNRLKVGVDRASAISLAEQELSRLGIPRAAVNLVVTDPVVFAATLQHYNRPIEGGLQISFRDGAFLYACTLGFNGIRSVAGFAVNSHCTANQGGVEGTQHYQPSVAGENFIGTEIADPRYTRSNCPRGIRGRVCRWSDSAYSQLATGVAADLGFIARPDAVNNGSLTIAEGASFRIVSEGDSVVGQTLNKVGRTTGWTQGPVTATCVNTGVSGTNIVQLCQDFVRAGLGGGDSGSPVFSITDPQGYDVQLRGILWGGSGDQFVYSPIRNIQRNDELGPISTCASGFTC